MKHTNNTMNAIVASGYGTPDVLSLHAIERPEPKESELLICVEATPASRADLDMLSGKPLVGRIMIGLLKPKRPVLGTGDQDD